MDFIARAGSMLDRSHRIAGLLLIVCLIEGMAIYHFMSVNGDLNEKFKNIREELKVYVVPGSKADIYSPTNMDILRETFVDYVIQSMKTYTYETFAIQQNELSRFFIPSLKNAWEKKIDMVIEEVESLQKSSLFVPNRSSLKITEKKGSIPSYNISIEGSTNYFVAGDLTQTVPMVIKLTVKRSDLSKSNPFGFVLVKYKEGKKY